MNCKVYDVQELQLQCEVNCKRNIKHTMVVLFGSYFVLDYRRLQIKNKICENLRKLAKFANENLYSSPIFLCHFLVSGPVTFNFRAPFSQLPKN